MRIVSTHEKYNDKSAVFFIAELSRSEILTGADLLVFDQLILWVCIESGLNRCKRLISFYLNDENIKIIYDVKM